MDSKFNLPISETERIESLKKLPNYYRDQKMSKSLLKKYKNNTNSTQDLEIIKEIKNARTMSVLSKTSKFSLKNNSKP